MSSNKWDYRKLVSWCSSSLRSRSLISRNLSRSSCRTVPIPSGLHKHAHCIIIVIIGQCLMFKVLSSWLTVIARVHPVHALNTEQRQTADDLWLGTPCRTMLRQRLYLRIIPYFDEDVSAFSRLSDTYNMRYINSATWSWSAAVLAPR